MDAALFYSNDLITFALMIQIPLLNPVRFIDLNNINSSFDGNFSLFQFKSNTLSKCYLQKFQTSDILRLQIITDLDPTDLEFRNKYDQALYTVPWVKSTRVIQALPDLGIWEIEESLIGIADGKYSLYFECGADTFESEPIEIAFEHKSTILLRYKNSQNNYNTIFDTGIEFEFRVESDIRNFVPKNDRETYNDQIYNATQLFSVAYRSFTFFVGYERGVPDWVIDKVNQITQCDQVAYNDVYYQPIAGAEFEVIRLDQYFLAGATLDIQPTDNNFNKYVTVPDQSGQTFTPVQKVTPFANGSGNQTISGVFGISANLEKVIIYKAGADYTINIGITPGGSEIGSFLVDNASTVKTVEWTFTGNTNVYLSGAGLNYTLLYLVWKQLDENPVPVGTQPSPPPVGANAGMFFFEKNAGDLALAFDLATGLGLQNGAWSDWCIAGTNGTVNMDGKFPIGWDRTDTITIGTETGSNQITIAKANLPAQPLNIRVSLSGSTSWRTSGGSGTPITNVGGIGAGDAVQTGQTANLGDGTPIEHTPLSIICVYVIKLT